MIKKLLLLFITTASFSFSQTVFEPVHSDVYTFLDLMAQKGIIDFHDEIKPVSRQYIAEKLLEVREAGERKPEAGERRPETGREITSLENEELEFYLKDFGMEISDLTIKLPVNIKPDNKELDNKKPDSSFTTIINKDPFERYRLFSYGDSLFKINISPVLGYEFGKRGDANYSHRWNGLYMYGYLGKNMGYSFRFQDNSENGTTTDKTKNFTPVTGVIVAKTHANNIQYSEINASLAYDWSWGDLSVGKDFLNWGYGQSGLLVLSDKAPSFPFVRLDIRPVKWLSFNYIHAWLASDVIDSTSSYATLNTSERIIYRNKYLASHTLTATPVSGLDVSLGESIVYSDNLELSYLVPIMFFRLAQAYLSQRNDGAGGNSQFFLSVSSRNQLKNTHLYGTLFIDEITLEGLFNNQTQRNQIGFTLGGSVTDLPFENATFTLEYTKIYPYVYNNYIQTQTYQSSDYLLGDWIGDNADLFYAALNYRFLRGLQATLWGQYIRKGAEETVAQDGIQPQPPFLFGLRTNYSYMGAEIKYEIVHELFARIQFQTTNTSKQAANLSYSDNRMNELYFALYYGIH
jgi:hypothetical protein